jgi:hypothetical protein
MTTELPDPVCTCGSCEYRTHCQKQCEPAAGVPHDGWTTIAQRMANPHWKVSNYQNCIWVGDDTWIVCAKCGAELTKEHCDAVWAAWRERHPEWQPGPFRIFEEIGEAVINDYAVSRIIIE